MMHGQKTIKLICHYDLLSQTVGLLKSMCKRAFFCFSAAPGNYNEDLLTFQCHLRHKFAIKALLCNTKYFNKVHSDM
jgi:hypothetical protein